MSAAKTPQQILHVGGFSSCGFYRRTVKVLGSLSLLFPDRLRVVEHTFSDRDSYRSWLIDDKESSDIHASNSNNNNNNTGFRNRFASVDARATNHVSSPFVWSSRNVTSEPDPTDILSFLGGHDDTFDWCRRNVQNMNMSPSSPLETNNNVPTTTATATATEEVIEMVPDGYTKDHGYDYDLCVIGGGSGGLAAAKEAATLGAKVACLDFVKPSPQGTKWGLGGTCVNVGCIPKKLYHYSAQLRETIHSDSDAFGIVQSSINTNSADAAWVTIQENIQNYIRGLNFKYRVSLREKNVTYFNKLGKFVDKNTLEVTDKRGNTELLTAARFLVAVGGRPSPLSCDNSYDKPLSISSDDVFSLPNNPGKTLCVGASYIGLECAGFLAGLGNDVTVAVRSILLRGFDRGCVDRIENYMSSDGDAHNSHKVTFRKGVTPTKLEKIDEKIRVTFSDGSSDNYDTVLSAIGRSADTTKLGLDSIAVQTNPSNGKILAKHEQSVSCPNVYAVGDVLEGSPELTPVAIQAGIFLARRLFGASKKPMDYVNICTTVFTPIEYSCVGMSEEEAIEYVGGDSSSSSSSSSSSDITKNPNLEVYHSEFIPLEWSLSQHRGMTGKDKAYAKIIVDKRFAADNNNNNNNNKSQQKVLGIHYVGPNAGEIMQGYGTAMKTSGGLTLQALMDTVGIHPTSSEEIVKLSVTKSSGEDAAAGGC